ncbi:aminopeptidase P family protein [Rhodobacter calidifons]|uniref:Aminopeptidase P family protein n=1 Tax=Rhodobacter calidifons TaxID=2715277 RepID=A0ABX0GA72_9RHOB|nr:aminopeptidase P family protein [Rhodobacter calidifons]NHB78190.1 aminopeptidase P family protein [Rhodobacter calidifons]
MFQSFDSHASPDQGPPRLLALRAKLAAMGLQGFIVPRADVHQGEYVAPRDERLQWLTGFTGSAGFCIVLPDAAGVFIDGRYRTQVKAQVDLSVFTPVPWPEVKPGDWVKERLTAGVVGFDPWLHTADEVERLQRSLEGTGVTVSSVSENPVDTIWPDQPAAPAGKAFVHPVALAGESHADKRARLAEALRKAGQRAAVITLPDSLCWLLNIRGADVPKNPVLHGLAVLHDDARVDLFVAPAKLDEAVRAHLGPEVAVHPVEGFAEALKGLAGPVRVDKTTAPLAVSEILKGAGVEVAWGDDPCRLPKACKNAAEIAATREAHLRDGAAMVEFLRWLDEASPSGGLTEISVVQALEGFRRATNALHDISFDTICGAGPNGAIMHYRVTEETNRPVAQNELLLVDSGAQYADGTTDITRTVAIGDPGQEARECYTRVLQGLIAISRVRFPKGLAGRDIDALARFNLWVAGQDYDHGTGHGVGAFLSVHEGPQRISRVSEVPLEPGMILSNEPGYYREGAFGIRLENLIVVQAAPPLGDNRAQLAFETLTFVPFDRRLILREELSKGERRWLDAYHAEVLEKLGNRVSGATLDWLTQACAPI